MEGTRTDVASACCLPVSSHVITRGVGSLMPTNAKAGRPRQLCHPVSMANPEPGAGMWGEGSPGVWRGGWGTWGPRRSSNGSGETFAASISYEKRKQCARQGCAEQRYRLVGEKHRAANKDRGKWN